MKKIRQIFLKLLSDDLLRHTSILFSGMMVVHVCNMVFQMAVSRALPKEEYALLTAFLAALAIIQRPLVTLSTGISHYTSLLKQDCRIGDITLLLRKWLVLCVWAGLSVGGVAVLLNRSVAGFLHLDRSAPVVIGGIILPALFCLSVLGGVGQGLQLFRWTSASSIFGALVRLGLGAGFVWFLFPACGWAMLGHGIGIYTSAAVLLLGLFLSLHGEQKSSEVLPSMRYYLLQSFFVQAAYAVLMTADVVLMKHYFPEDTEFAYAATLGRMVVFLPGAVVMAMFPKVASRRTISNQQRTVFIRSFTITAIFVAVAVAVCLVVPGLLSRVLFGIGQPTAYLRGMIGGMAFVMGLAALLNVVVSFLMAQHRFSGASGVILMSLLYLVGAHFSASSRQLVVCAGLANLVALIWVSLIALRIKVGVEQEGNVSE